MSRTVFSRIHYNVLIFLSLILLACNNGNSSTTSDLVTLNATQKCTFNKAVVTDGIRRLAIVIGVSDYQNDIIPDLEGPQYDAMRMYELLTGKNGYGFPKQNVCLLLNSDATTAAFKTAFQKGLVERAKKGDVAVLYYAGHGSQKRDTTGTEADGLNETFLFHDARVGKVRDFVDNKMNRLLKRLYQKTTNIVAIFDMCNAMSATRDVAKSSYVSRFFVADTVVDNTDSNSNSDDNDGGNAWLPEVMPGLIALTAASDGTPAVEKDKRGIFTDALIKVLSPVSKEPITYAQLARQVPPLVAAQSYQIPAFQGDLNKVVFGNKKRQRPIAWEINRLTPSLEITGTPMPGMGVGAELRIYGGSVMGAATRDPAKAKATIVIDSMTSLNAKAHVTAKNIKLGKLTLGDIAVLVRPADKYVGISVRLRSASKPGGIPQSRATGITHSINSDDEAKLLVHVTNGKADFELSMGSDKKIILWGPEDKVRVVYDNDRAIAKNLWQHARQQAMLLLSGETGGDFIDNETLQVSLLPARKQAPCAKGIWEQAKPNSQQIIPLCYRWNLKVTLAKNSPYSLLIGAVIYSADGGMYGLPADGRSVLLKPGEEKTFNSRRETFAGSLPLSTNDIIKVYGTQETNPVRWSELTQAARTRGTGGSSLSKALGRYLTPGTRGVSVVDEVAENTTWTQTTISTRVEANGKFLALKQGKKIAAPSFREYTIQNFDLRPYLPDDKNSALFKVLKQSDWLVNKSTQGGIRYRQHSWKQATDKANLKLGIDCSRFIWYVFTRAGLKYNKNNKYLATAMMVKKNTVMNTEFQRCDNGPSKIGDVLVYRSSKKGDGHVVMVIDPVKRIAVGSHGYDGNVRFGKKPETGAEYQLIKVKKNWKAWDRKDMKLAACYRHRAFAKEENSRGALGVQALSNICSSNKQCINTVSMADKK